VPVGYVRAMGVIGWAEVAALLTSVGFGTLSAVLPVANAEAYVAASQFSHAAGPVAVVVGIAVGQTIGKILLFYGVRRGKEFKGVRHRRAVLRMRPVGPARARFRASVRSLLTLVGRKRWGLPITFVAAVVGLPPLYAVALLAGATRMRLHHFGAVVLVGRLLRFVLVAYGVEGLHG
jgi:membrane protein YqaA with SNARE-associated domain